MGWKFNKDKNQFIHCQEQEAIDKKLMMEGESRNQRMARITVEAMNSINIDLEFTVECEEEFSNERLPTLDFAICQEKDGQITHSYFKKEMKTPLVIIARSGMSVQQKIQILANDLTRRLYNISKDKIEQEEYNKIIDQLTKELKNAEYNYKTAREIIISGIRGWKTRLARREEKGQEIYRLAKNTAKIREYKKLMSRETWYKPQEQKSEACQGVPEPWQPTQARKEKKITKTGQGSSNKQNTAKEIPTQAVMFIPYTPGSELAKLLRNNEEKIAKLTKSRLKIVERAGIKLHDMITQ